MKKNNNRKGFTLAELLIVVAIIAVLTAIAIPVFSSQLEKSKEATDQANVRSAYAEVVTLYLTDNAAHTMSVTPKQAQANWQNSANGKLVIQKDGAETAISIPAKTSDKYIVAISASGVVTVS